MHLARNLTGARLLVIGTYRDVEVDRAHPLSGTLAELRRIGAFDRVPLRGLTVDEVQRMMSAIRGQEVPWSRAEAVYRQTEGNPLFVQEVLRYVVEEGLVTREGGQWRRTDDGAAESGIPEGLRDVIGKRLSRLSPACNQVLAVAAVIGRDFGLETLRRVADLAEEPLVAAIEEALRAAVLQDQSRSGVIRYRFAHAFFRQTLYEELSAPRRLRQHQQVARALEAQYANRLEEHAAELAEHFAHSTDAADLTKAVRYSELAARRAVSVYVYGEAARLLEQAIEVQEVLDPEDRAKRCDLLLALGEALLPAGEPQRAVDAGAPRALELAETLHDDRRASRACQLAVEAMLRFGGAVTQASPEYGRWAERADRYAAPGTVERVLADIALAIHWDVTDRRGAAWVRHQRALALARELDDPDVLFQAVAPMLVLADTLRTEEEILRLAREFSARPREGVRAHTLSRILGNSAGYFLSWGERARVEELGRELTELSARTQDSWILLSPIRDEIRFATIDGRLEDAIAAGVRLLERAEELGMPVFGQLNARIATRCAMLHLGRGEEVLASESADTEVESLCLAHLGRRTEAHAALHRYLAEHDITHDDSEIGVPPLTRLLETAVLVADRESVASLAPPLARFSAMSSAHLTFTYPARHLGAAAALLGDRKQARAYYEQAIEAAGKIRFRPEIALTRLQPAELLLEGSADERAEGLEHLDFAIEEFREMKMQPALARALSHKDVLKA